MILHMCLGLDANALAEIIFFINKKDMGYTLYITNYCFIFGGKRAKNSAAKMIF